MRPRVVTFVGVLAVLLVLGARGQDNVTNSATLQVFSDLKSYEDCDMGRYESNYLGSLNYSACNTIVESGLAQVAMIKLAQPNTELKKLKQQIDELVVNGATARIRYKAYLASIVFAQPEIFFTEKHGTYMNGEELFTALAERLQKELLATQ